MSKHTLPCLIVLILATTSSHSSEPITTLSTGDLNNPTGDERGNWHYQSATLEDKGFTCTGKLSPTMALQSVSFLRYKDLNNERDSTPGSIRLVILTDPGDLTSKVAESNNGIDVFNTSPGSIMTWKFNAEPISSSKEYFYAFYKDNSNNGKIDANDTPAIARIANIQGGSSLQGLLRKAPHGNISTTDDAYISIGVTPAIEVAPSALLGIGNITLILRPKN